ncbi:hypothetical protein [Enterococcus sp.]|uniref:hypothetical protein n=1 Tax=Enterococcus sp. TaxID=35783 RepID=UPI00289F1836|nr:hypothetical protein [Enterococcus sp.]
MMIIFLFTLVALVLFATSYMLYAKQAIFFTMIPKTANNQAFLKLYSVVHLVLGLLAILVAVIDLKLIALFYLALLLISSAAFSIMLAHKMKKSGD